MALVSIPFPDRSSSQAQSRDSDISLTPQAPAIITESKFTQQISPFEGVEEARDLVTPLLVDALVRGGLIREDISVKAINASTHFISNGLRNLARGVFEQVVDDVKPGGASAALMPKFAAVSIRLDVTGADPVEVARAEFESVDGGIRLRLDGRGHFSHAGSKLFNAFVDRARWGLSRFGLIETGDIFSISGMDSRTFSNLREDGVNVSVDHDQLRKVMLNSQLFPLRQILAAIVHHSAPANWTIDKSKWEYGPHYNVARATFSEGGIDIRITAIYGARSGALEKETFDIRRKGASGEYIEVQHRLLPRCIEGFLFPFRSRENDRYRNLTKRIFSQAPQAEELLPASAV